MPKFRPCSFPAQEEGPALIRPGPGSPRILFPSLSEQSRAAFFPFLLSVSGGRLPAVSVARPAAVRVAWLPAVSIARPPIVSAARLPTVSVARLPAVSGAWRAQVGQLFAFQPRPKAAGGGFGKLCAAVSVRGSSFCFALHSCSLSACMCTSLTRSFQGRNLLLLPSTGSPARNLRSLSPVHAPRSPQKVGGPLTHPKARVSKLWVATPKLLEPLPYTSAYFLVSACP